MVFNYRTYWEYQFTLISETISLIVESLNLLPADSSIKLSYCGLERAIVHLKERFAVDTLEIKVVQPKPKIVRRQEATTI